MRREFLETFELSLFIEGGKLNSLFYLWLKSSGRDTRVILELRKMADDPMEVNNIVGLVKSLTRSEFLAVVEEMEDLLKRYKSNEVILLVGELFGKLEDGPFTSFDGIEDYVKYNKHGRSSITKAQYRKFSRWVVRNIKSSKLFKSYITWKLKDEVVFWLVERDLINLLNRVYNTNTKEISNLVNEFE